MLASPVGPAVADKSESKDPADLNWERSTQARGFDVQVQEAQKNAVQKSVEDVVQTTVQEVSTGSGDTESNQVEVLTPYCMTQEGIGMLDCFAVESNICTSPGSQYVVRSIYLPDSSEAATRIGDPFCSEPSDPVVSDPAVEEEAEAPPMPVVTLADFRRLDISPSQIESDSGGFGLIRANTNFYATEESQTLNTTMLGQAVAIQAVPVRWTWDYGDGSEPLSNPYPGGPQREFNQETTTSHAYQDTGEFPVSLTTSYRGQFSVNGGPWIAIPGVAEVPSEPVSADIWRSKSKNVAENCVENPDGWACGDPFVED
ncbi:PKD domain-containing protein [Citricoccus nitrophenolicus]|uniref:PKD domain-containing protein n=1 Tax=Citricoccus nitrophenolicus TaxID=863575 RepID=UPI0039B4E306